MRSIHLTVFCSMILFGLTGLGCSGTEFGGRLGSLREKNQSQNADSDADREVNSSTRDPAEAEDEDELATQPVQVAGAFLTIDCAPSEEGSAPQGFDPIACAIVDTATWTKYAAQTVTLDAVASVFEDGREELLPLTAAPAASPWHVLTYVPKDAWKTIVGIKGKLTESTSYFVLNKELGRYQPDTQTQPPPAEPEVTVQNHGVTNPPSDRGTAVKLRVHSAFAISLPNFQFTQTVDGKLDTNWLAQPPAARSSWVYYELESPGLITSLWLTAAQEMPCATKHKIWVSTEPYTPGAMDPFPQETLLATVAFDTKDKSLLEIKMATPRDKVRFIRIATLQACSPIGWYEVELFR